MNSPTPITIAHPTPSLEDVDLKRAVIQENVRYRKALKKAQLRILRVQQAYHHQGRRALIVFEGWDASGKGGAIRRLTQRLDPRGYSVVPIAAPSEDEQSRHYLYRFFKDLPPAGKLTIFDRSYYGRVLVERVEGFASEKEWQRAFTEINEFERLIADDGVRVVKLFLHIDQQEQAKRFLERINNPLKQWKLSAEDIRNHKRWSDYQLAINEMFERTSTELAPWNIVPANHKRFARLEVLNIIISALERDVDLRPPKANPELVRLVEETLNMQATT